MQLFFCGILTSRMSYKGFFVWKRSSLVMLYFPCNVSKNYSLIGSHYYIKAMISANILFNSAYVEIEFKVCLSKTGQFVQKLWETFLRMEKMSLKAFKTGLNSRLIVSNMPNMFTLQQWHLHAFARLVIFVRVKDEIFVPESITIFGVISSLQED